jgi:hypothetical protein
LVGDEASNLERLMVESRVVRNAADGHGHMRRRSVAFDGPSASFGRPQKEVPVPSERESRGVVRVADAVEAWLELWMGDHSYTVIGPVQVRSTP